MESLEFSRVGDWDPETGTKTEILQMHHDIFGVSTFRQASSKGCSQFLDMFPGN